MLATGHDTDKKTVTLNFLGDGKRPVRVGYIQEAPIWKTSYRLVLKDNEKPFLQGWAIVENTTEEDWNDVDLTLVSGRPISFVMDLYQPLYVSRPRGRAGTVCLAAPADLRPGSGRDGEFRVRDAADGEADRPTGRWWRTARRGAGSAHRPMGDMLRGGSRLTQCAAGADARARNSTRCASNLGSQGVQSLAQAGDVGELFQYEIATPVTLPRQQSAMLPIVNESVKGEKVSIYNQAVQAKHPLNGLRLKNTTDLHLMQGPITVFDGGAYAGDAQIEDLQPGTERLISYALDLDTEVAPEVKRQPGATAQRQARQRRAARHAASIDARSKVHRQELGQESQEGADRVSARRQLEARRRPKEPTEKTRDLYRFAVTAEPGKPATLVIEEERTVNQQVRDQQSRRQRDRCSTSTPKVVSDKVKAALQK